MKYLQDDSRNFSNIEETKEYETILWLDANVISANK